MADLRKSERSMKICSSVSAGSPIRSRPGSCRRSRRKGFNEVVAIQLELQKNIYQAKIGAVDKLIAHAKAGRQARANRGRDRIEASTGALQPRG
jgi:hypothetical protein